MDLLTVSLAELVDRALLEVQNQTEQGLRVVMSTPALSTTAGTSFRLVSADAVHPTDLIEFGDELVMVASKSDDIVPNLTCSRGYYQTTPGVHPDGTVGFVNPQFPRHRVAEAVRRSFARIDALGVSVVLSGVFQREPGQQHVLLPTGTKEVFDVFYNAGTGRLVELDRWRFEHSLPTSTFSTGNAVLLPTYVSDIDELVIRYRAPYRWSSYPNKPTMSSTITVPEGAEDLPSLYAACWLLSAREISRHEIDRSEEWNRSEPVVDRGSPGQMVRSKWQEFYRALDEARRVNHMPARRQYHKMPRRRL